MIYNKQIIIIMLCFPVALYSIQLVPNCSDISVSELTNNKPVTKFNITDILDIHEKLKTGYLYVQTVGESMIGVINPNQRCLCEVKEYYEIGDIILFFSGNGIIAHEVVYKTKSGFITKGTNNDFADGEIKKSEALCSIQKVNRLSLFTR